MQSQSPADARRVTVAHLEVFAAAPGGGNPCPIVLDAQHLGSGEMQSIAAALGLAYARVDDDLPIRSVSVSRPKLIVPLRRADDVHRCDPDLEHLWSICRQLDVTGAYPFAPGGDHFVARQFPVDAGYPEDPATGVAAAALGEYRSSVSGTATFSRREQLDLAALPTLIAGELR